MMLALHEEITLLTLDPATQKFPTSLPEFYYCITSALLVELSTKGMIRRDAEGCLIVTGKHPTGDPLLDEATSMIAKARKPRGAHHWILQLSGMRRLRQRIITALVQKGIITLRKQSFLFITFTRYVPVNPAVIESLKEKIRITENGLRNERIATLIALIIGAERATKHLFNPREWNELKSRFSTVVKGHPFSEVVRSIIFEGNDGTATLLLLTSITAIDSGAPDGGDGSGD
jgi:hypothetical protein